MKICDVTQFYSPVSGGVKRYISEKRRHVVEHTRDEHHLIIPGAETRYEREGRLHLHTIHSPRLDFFSRYPSRYRLILNTRLVLDLLDDIRPDIIESGDPYHLAWTALRAGQQLHAPVFGFYHSHFPEAYLRTALKYGGAWLRDAVLNYAEDYIVKLYSHFTATLVPSEHLRQLLHGWGVTNSVTLNLGVDTATFSPAPRDPSLRADLGLPADKKILLYVGRLSPEKNIEMLLAAFEALHARHPHAYHLVVVGDGPLRRVLPATRHRTNGALTWRSYIQDNAGLTRYYHAADLFIHPGVCETFGLVVLEAQACGLPCVGVRGSFMDANVMVGLDRWASRNDPHDIADAIERFSREDLTVLGAEASKLVRARFSWDNVFARQWTLYTRARLHGVEALHSIDPEPFTPNLVTG
ncbi:MAG: glycosyltransferase [Methylacidiphilales bacterium]|nr:glycosyltransferase [Candidatus Methylacidiphilales bacterium]